MLSSESQYDKWTRWLLDHNKWCNYTFSDLPELHTKMHPWFPMLFIYTSDSLAVDFCWEEEKRDYWINGQMGGWKDEWLDKGWIVFDE